MDDPKHDAANLLMGLCLTKLVEMERVHREQVIGTWRIEFNGEKFQRTKFGGAASLDSMNRPVVYLSPQLNIEGLMFVSAPEAVHLALFCRGDFFPAYGFSIWKEQEYVLLSADDPNYSNQPWEAEANELSPVLFAHLKSRVDSARQNAT
jgi:hypothetical protein